MANPAFGPEERPLQELADGEFRKLRKAVRKLERDPPDDALHEVRIKGKRSRYAAGLDLENSRQRPRVAHPVILATRRRRNALQQRAFRRPMRTDRHG